MNSVLAGLYERAEGAVAFIDESYQVPLRGSAKSFYITCAVIVRRDKLDQFRQSLKQIVNSDFWHTSEAARGTAGRNTIHALAAHINVYAKSVCWIYEPLDSSDREGESARAQSLRSSIYDLVRKHLPAAGLIIYESRRPGYQENADKRVIGELRTLGKLDRDFMVHGESPANEALLWAPDLVAWVYRQEFTNRTSEYFNRVRESTELVHLNSKSRLP